VSIDRVLEDVTRVPGVNMAAVCAYDGLCIATQAAFGMENEDRVAAMSAEIGRAVKALVSSWDGGGFGTAAFEAATGKLVISDTGRAFLTVVTDQNANTGLLRLKVEQAAEELKEALAPAPPGADPGQPPEATVGTEEAGPD